MSSLWSGELSSCSPVAALTMSRIRHIKPLEKARCRNRRDPSSTSSPRNHVLKREENVQVCLHQRKEASTIPPSLVALGLKELI